MNDNNKIQIKNIPVTCGLALILSPNASANSLTENYTRTYFDVNVTGEFPTNALADKLKLPYSLESFGPQKRLSEIERLEDNWNGYGAKKIDKTIIQRSKSLIHGLVRIYHEIFIFPTARGTIQLEFQDVENSNFEIEIFPNEYVITKVEPNDDEEDFVMDKESDIFNILS